MVNDASQVYESSFNITLGIQNLTISDGSCPGSPSETAPWNQKCSNDVDLSDRLNLFSAWRGKNADSNAYWTLLSTCNTDSAVGLAWLGQLCRPGASANSGGRNETVAGANVVAVPSGRVELAESNQRGAPGLGSGAVDEPPVGLFAFAASAPVNGGGAGFDSGIAGEFVDVSPEQPKAIAALNSKYPPTARERSNRKVMSPPLF